VKRLALLLSVALAIASWFFLRNSSQSAPVELTVWLTADVRGRLVPCGCFSGQFGGLTRVSSVVAQSDPKNTLRLDAGDALEGPEDYHRIELGYIHKAFAKMGYDAANVGHREARLSAADLRSLSAASPVPLLSANLLDAQTGAPLLKTHTIANRGPWRIAIVGVMDETLSADELGAGLRLEKMSTTIGQLLPSLKKDADFLILLAFTNQERLRGLAREFPEFALVLGGKVTEPAQQLVTEGSTGVFYVTNESKALGEIHLALKSPGISTVPRAEVMLMHDKLEQDPDIAALAERYRDEIRITKLLLDDPSRTDAGSIPGVRAASTFAGSEACTKCHAKAANAWSKSGHAHAFRTLVARKADADPNCIGCHTVGFEKAGGYRREYGETKLVNVGCESCHGPAAKHIERVTVGDLESGRMRKLGAADCVKCHHGEFSRPFDWEKFWPEIQH
jgi:hypothetical protein